MLFRPHQSKQFPFHPIIILFKKMLPTIFGLLLSFLLIPCVSASPIPIKGYVVSGQFVCNDLPLIGTIFTTDPLVNCSRITISLDIPDQKLVKDFMEPFSDWNATFTIACGQTAELFDTEQQPVISIIHNCPSPSNGTNSEEQKCRDYEVTVPEENIGKGNSAEIMDLGNVELSGLGFETECPATSDANADADDATMMKIKLEDISEDPSRNVERTITEEVEGKLEDNDDDADEDDEDENKNE